MCVNWYNNKRLHSTLGYMCQKEFREFHFAKLAKKVLAINFLLIVLSINYIVTVISCLTL